MREVRAAFGGVHAGDAFWPDYARYWLDRVEADATAWMARFAEKSAALARAGVPVVGELDALPGPAAACVAEWRDALAHGAGALAALGQCSPARQRDLAFHFMHLMNNRLGLQPIEEAYFAALVGADGSRA
jgi:hypothetical protein